MYIRIENVKIFLNFKSSNEKQLFFGKVHFYFIYLIALSKQIFEYCITLGEGFFDSTLRFYSHLLVQDLLSHCVYTYTRHWQIFT